VLIFVILSGDSRFGRRGRFCRHPLHIDARFARSQDLVKTHGDHDDSAHHHEFQGAVNPLQVHNIAQQLNHGGPDKKAKDAAFTSAQAATAQNARGNSIELKKNFRFCWLPPLKFLARVSQDAVLILVSSASRRL
jgi:hypothetical protein